MKALVTGSSGHLGEALARTLRDAGRDAVGLEVVPGPLTTRIESLMDRASVRRAMAGAYLGKNVLNYDDPEALDITPAAEAVIHAAGASSPDCWLKHLPVE